MPKCCVALECGRSEGVRESYYKFPLHDKVRLKQWLANINLDNFFPTKNQYLCSKHFKPSCFQVRWGIRYLRHDAVPTIFSSGAVTRTHAAKPKMLTSAQTVNGEACIPTVSHLGIGQTLPLSNALAIALDPSSSASQMTIDGAQLLVKNTNTLAVHNTVMGAVNLMPLVHIVESFDGLSLALAPSQGFSSVALPIEVTGAQQIHEMPLVEPVAILSEEQLASTSLQCGFYNGQVLQCAGEELPTFIAMSEDSGSGALVIENISIEPYFETAVPAETPASMSTEDVMAYLETMQTATVVPAVSTGPLPPLMPSQETVLSTSITRPIASTVPIVSKHGKEVSVSISEPLSTDQPQEPDETLTTGELVSVVVNLQNKVKALQQRHQKHCSKLEAMEGVVEQLKTENLVSEENMNLLELACLNSTPASAEDNTAIAIVCQDDDQTMMYSLPIQGENQPVYHITRQ
ncbi:THAP domain-containing protein 5-like [Pseudophryne corroboree]|uniref:THAP domain-containing protein 5-like n=1 Tax=Pseudophryne corroboree TaxID=495146 RepID=UPI0030813549